MRQIDSGVAREAAEDLSTGLQVARPAVSQQGAAPQVARSARSSRKSLYSRVRENFRRRHLFQTTIFLVGIGSFGIFLGTRIRPAIAQPSAIPQVDTASSVPARGSEPRPEQQTSSVSSGVPSPKAPQTRAGESSIRTFTYVIQPTDTLKDLCVSMVGRYDSKVLSEIRRLNPNLKNLDHLHVGEEIRLPISLAK